MSVINFTLAMYNLCFTSYFNIFNIDVKKQIILQLKTHKAPLILAGKGG